MSNDKNNHRKDNKDEPDSGNDPLGDSVEKDGNNEHAGAEEASTFEVSIDWKLFIDGTLITSEGSRFHTFTSPNNDLPYCESWLPSQKSTI